MARYFAWVPVNINQIDLNWYYRNFASEYFHDNEYRVILGNTYEDIYAVEVSDPSDLFGIGFGGQGFSFSSSGAVTGGTVSAMGEYDSFGSLWHLDGFTAPATDIYSAALTRSNADDLALLADVLIGNDEAFLSNGSDNVNGFNGHDTIHAGDGNDTVHGGNGDDVLNGHNGDDRIYGGNQNDEIYAGNGNDLIFGGNGSDLIDGGNQGDRIYAGNGNDTVAGGNGRDTAFLGNGNDRYEDTGQGGWIGADKVFGVAGNDYIATGGGDDTLAGGIGEDTLAGEDGNDLLEGSSGFDRCFGGGGNDTVIAGHGRDTVYLGDGNDIFEDSAQTGYAGGDRVFAGAGQDLIRLDGGNDTVNGGTGQDRFEFVGATIATDTIVDYEVGIDELGFDDALWGVELTEAQVVNQFADVIGGNVVFDFGDGNTVTLNGVGTTTGLVADIEIF